MPTRFAAPSDEGSNPERKRRQLYGRRKGPKLSPTQAALFDTLLPQLELQLVPGADPRSYFSPPPTRGGRNAEQSESISVGGSCANAPHPLAVLATSPQGGGDIQDVWLEIGFGAGEHLVWQAQHHPRVGLIGAEPYESGVAKLLSKLATDPLDNIRIHMGDARDVIAALPDASLGRVFILFPDPWPKTRHHKRRFVQTEMLDNLARVMKPGALLRFASDDAPLIEYTLERLMAHPHFTWAATQTSDWLSRPSDWPSTRYEAKELHGKPVYLEFRRA